MKLREILTCNPSGFQYIDDLIVIKMETLFSSFSEFCFILVGQTILYSACTLLMDRNQRKVASETSAEIQPPHLTEEGVTEEFSRLAESRNADQLKVVNLHKIYKNNLHAVKGISFGIKQGQILALLGPNVALPPPSPFISWPEKIVQGH